VLSQFWDRDHHPLRRSRHIRTQPFCLAARSQAGQGELREGFLAAGYKPNERGSLADHARAARRLKQAKTANLIARSQAQGDTSDRHASLGSLCAVNHYWCSCSRPHWLDAIGSSKNITAAQLRASTCGKAAGEKAGLSEQTARAVCLERHQKYRNDSDMEGRASYSSGEGSVSFSGRLTNKSNNIIFTEYTVIVSHANTKERESKTFKGRWIEPGSTDTFMLESADLKHRPPPDSRGRDKFDWFLTSAKGIEITF
jgi:hypothetical protein